MKKHLAILLLTVMTVILFSCDSNNSKTNNSQSPIVPSDSTVSIEIKIDQLDTIVSSIIDISANDFYKNQQPSPVDFKNVKLKYIKKTSGEELYILCGQFVTNDQQETPFATIKNSDYEQWVGKNALTYCQDSKEISYTKEDLSTLLKNKFNSLKVR